MRCEHLTGCAFFRRLNGVHPATIELFQELYCNRTPERCARWQVARSGGKEQVPEDLSPEDMKRAETILRNLQAGS